MTAVTASGSVVLTFAGEPRPLLWSSVGWLAVGWVVVPLWGLARWLRLPFS